MGGQRNNEASRAGRLGFIQKVPAVGGSEAVQPTTTLIAEHPISGSK